MNLTQLTKCFCWLKRRTVQTQTIPLCEYRDIWAEEGSARNPNSAEWSFGNGATGFIGLPIDAGWEVEAMYFHADTFAANARIQVDLMDYGNTPSGAAANTIASIELANAADGGGSTNNAYKYHELSAPVSIPVNGQSTVIGFITRTAAGTISDMRVGARLRRKIGDVVTNATLVG